MADGNAGSVQNRILARDAALLRETVREAGRLALSLFRTELKNWTKGASSPVSEADIAVNDLLENRLRSATPDYGWLSEESADDEARLGKSPVWIVDPSSQTVSLRSVEVARYDQAAVVISKGLETGEFVVTAGAQTLRPGQKVSILGAAS